MEDVWFYPEPKIEKRGVFDGRTVQASKIVNEKGQMSWRVWTWTDDGPGPEEYWIGYGKIRERGEPPYFGSGRLIDGMDEAKRAILIGAINQWQSEEIERLLKDMS